MTALGVSHSLSSHPKLIASPPSQRNDHHGKKKKAHSVKAPRQHDDSTNVMWEAGLAGERRPPTWRIFLKEQFSNPTCMQTKNDHRNQK